jgi:hypothetical protein
MHIILHSAMTNMLDQICFSVTTVCAYFVVTVDTSIYLPCNFIWSGHSDNITVRCMKPRNSVLPFA